MTNQEIKKLVQKIKKTRNKEAFVELYDYYIHRIEGYVFKRTLNTADTQDITANVFMKVLKSLDKFKFGKNKNSFHAWIFRIVGNEINTFQKKNRYTLSDGENIYDCSFREKNQEGDFS